MIGYSFGKLSSLIFAMTQELLEVKVGLKLTKVFCSISLIVDDLKVSLTWKYENSAIVDLTELTCCSLAQERRDKDLAQSNGTRKLRR